MIGDQYPNNKTTFFNIHDVGGNFAQHETHPYVSFGINKKAFEAVLGDLAKLFK